MSLKKAKNLILFGEHVFKLGNEILNSIIQTCWLACDPRANKGQVNKRP